MFRNTLIVLFSCFALAGHAQLKGKPALEFFSTNYDFGTIKEEVEKVTHEFVFTNSGNAPLVIQQVTASCGCTTPNWPKQPIAPGAKGKITVTYAATGRPGNFTKTITVFNNSAASSIQLTIHGVVTPKPLSQAQAFPVTLGGVKLKSTIISVGEIHKGSKKTVSVPVLNASNAAVSLSMGNVPKHISASIYPQNIAPGKEALIQLTFNSAKTDDWAFRNDPITLIVNNDAVASKGNRLNVASFISEDFSKLTAAQKAMAPVAVLLSKEVKLGKVKSNGTLTGSFEMRNTGKSPLLIRKVFSDCNCIAAALPRQGVAAGQTATIRFTLKADNAIGRKMENVNIMTNSPSATDLQLPVSWETTR